MLLIDAGNSRIKWGLWQGGAWLRRGAVGHAAGALQQSLANLPPPHSILVSNVAGEQAAQQISSVCSMWQAPLEYIAAQAVQCGVRNGYDQPAQLGSDRWAALIAAWHYQHAACLVVNCGTATTVDALSDAGAFLGGLILPGVDMMRHSLAGGTAQLEAVPGNWREFPCNMADAIYSGALRATVGAIRSQYRALGVEGAPCLMAGGAADEVGQHLDLPQLRMEDLVLQGLRIIGQESGKC